MTKSRNIPLTRKNPVHVRTYPNEDVVPSMPSRHSHINETAYVRMLKEEEQMDMIFNITVSAANWALLAGYLVVPGTFTSLQNSNEVEKVLQTNKAGRTALHTIQNPPLLAIACLLLVSGIAAFVWLLRFPKLRGNYLWLINKMFAPVTLNAAAGLLTTIINVCTSQGGDWSVMAIATTVVTGATLVSFLTLLVVYKFYKLERVRQEDELVTHANPSPKPNIEITVRH